MRRLGVLTVTLLMACSGDNSNQGLTTPPIVTAGVSTVVVGLPRSSIATGESIQATTSLRDVSGNTLTGRSVTWTSSDPSVATVGATAIVTGIAPGNAVIRATSEGVSGSATITVTPSPVATVMVSLSRSSVAASDSIQATASLRDASGNVLSGRSLLWESAEPSVATVGTTGIVVGIAPGSAIIKATSEGKTGFTTVTVTPVAVATVTVSAAQTSLNVGGAMQVSATLRDSRGNTLTDRVISWSTSNNAIATVSSSGIVNAVAVGVVNIIATSEGKADSLQVTVLAPIAASVTISPPGVTLAQGQFATLTATVRDAAQNVLTDQPIAWSSSNTAVVTVLQTGRVTAVSPGTSIITASSGGRNGTALITVTPISVASVTLNASTITMAVGDVRVLIAVARDADGNALLGRSVAWTSSNVNVVDGYVFGDTAVITGLLTGSAIVRATVEGKSASVPVTVIAVSLPVCLTIAGASIFGDDGQYLGRFTNQYDTQSVLNKYGTYGSDYSSTSTNNSYSQYGSPYSSLSARNPYASRPPLIVKNGQFIAYYTTNQIKTPGVSPAFALTCNFP